MTSLPPYRKSGKKKVFFLKSDGSIFAALVRNKHGTFLVNAGTQADGKVFYQFGLNSDYDAKFGLDGLTYLGQMQKVSDLADQLLGAQ